MTIPALMFVRDGGRPSGRGMPAERSISLMLGGRASSGGAPSAGAGVVPSGGRYTAREAGCP